MPVSHVVDLKKATPQAIAQENQPKTGSSPLPQSLNWEAPEFDAHEKSRGWHAALFGISGILILLMALFKNYTAAAFFGIAGAVLYLYGNKEPRVLTFTISGKGVEVAGRLYPYDSLRSFWIFYDPHMRRSEVSLRSNKTLMPYIRVPLGSTNPATVHALLSRFIPERKHADSVADTLSRKARF